MNYKKIARKINKLAAQISKMSDAKLQKQTEVIRKKIANKNKEIDILTYAFAVMREADKRIIGLYPNDEQVLGAIVIYYGDIAEMKTGEGKTLVATMPLYLRAMQMKGVFLVTTNDYLAHRDYEKMSKVYEWMGLSVGDGTKEDDNSEDNVAMKKEVYSKDIIYTSNGILGFDFLIDGLAANKDEKYLSKFNYAILDEVDAVLLDFSQTPLRISGAPKVQSNFFISSNNFVDILNEDVDYKIDEERKHVWLTEKGIENAKDYFDITNILSLEYFTLYQHLILALQARFVLKKDRDYLLDENEIKLLDFKNGRIMEGTRLQSGMHQALEAKEGVALTNETKTISSVTFQNLFRRFSILAGMTGTAKTDENEFIETYNMSVKKITTHKKNLRVDHKHQNYVTFNRKLEESMKKILELHELGRPILVIVSSVDTSELYSMYLFNLGIPHSVLNAKNHYREAMIIKEAGRKNAVTVATAMAGRGTDIIIDDDSIELGGLAVVLTETMPSFRIELQAKGRAGRQGLPGDTYAYSSLEDDIIKENVQESIQKYYNKHRNKDRRIRRPKVNKMFKKAQEKSDDKGRSSRMNNLQFDEISRLQKNMVTTARDKILVLPDIKSVLEFLLENAKAEVQAQFKQSEVHDRAVVKRYILDNVDYNFKEADHKNTIYDKKQLTSSEAIDFVISIYCKSLFDKQNEIKNNQVFLSFLQVVILRAVDNSWSSQVDSLSQLQTIVQNRSSAQKTPILEFDREAKISYNKYRKNAAKDILRNTALSMLQIKKGELVVIFP